uniref:Uncharacterized protein n=1 Tax=Opuntia streptacantha TaxID=393608 RepID=A0A7C8YZR8_OPUST
MASKCSRFISRTSLSCLKSSIKSTSRPPPTSAPRPSSPPLRSTSSPLPRFSFSRIPTELGGVQSLMPLHSAVATARMTSCLSTTSRTCRALSQGTLCCTSPSL